MLSLAALHAERSSALIFPVSRPTQSIIYYAKRYSGWHHRAHHCSSSIVERVFCVSHTLAHQVYTRHPLWEKRFKVFLSQRRGSCYSLFLLISCSHTEILVPSCSHTCSVHHCFLLCCRKGTSRMQTFPCHMNNLVNSPWMALGTGFFCLFVFKSVSTGHSASVVEKNSVLQQHSGSFHH